MSNQAPYGTPPSDFQSQYQGGGYPPGPPPGADKKIVAGICGILWDGLDPQVHLGYTVEGSHARVSVASGSLPVG